MKEKRTDMKFLLSVVLTAAICFAVGFWAAVKTSGSGESGITVGEAGSGAEDAAGKEKTDITDAAGADSAVVGPFTQIVMIRRYTESESVNIETAAAESPMYGLDEAGFARSYPQWEINGFSAEKVTLYKSIASCGPGTYKLTAYTAENNEIMAVYEYDREGEAKLLRIVGTPISLLTDAEADKVRAGIYVYGEDRLETLLQGYDE